MALYLVTSKVKINSDGSVCALNFYTINPIVNGIVLSSFDGYVLKDLNGLYLTAKESE
jgi:hypothetical protein